MKSPGLELCPHHVSLCTGIRSSRYKCSINVQLFTFITKSLNKLYIGLFVARSSNSLENDTFWSLSFSTFFLKFRQFWPKYLETIEKLHDFGPNHHKNYYPPPPLSPQSMLKKLAGNTSGSFVNTLCNIEMGEWGN